MMRGGLIVEPICPKMREVRFQARSGGLKLGVLVKLKNSARKSRYLCSVKNKTSTQIPGYAAD